MVAPENIQFDVMNFSAWFGKTEVLRHVSLKILPNEILSIIGPSNSGKTTFLRTLNRLNDTQPSFRMDGDIRFGGKEIRRMDAEVLRRRVGMVS